VTVLDSTEAVGSLAGGFNMKERQSFCARPGFWTNICMAYFVAPGTAPNEYVTLTPEGVPPVAGIRVSGLTGLGGLATR